MIRIAKFVIDERRFAEKSMERQRMYRIKTDNIVPKFSKISETLIEEIVLVTKDELRKHNREARRNDKEKRIEMILDVSDKNMVDGLLRIERNTKEPKIATSAS